MYGYRDKMVFCKLHPHKRCEHFCEVHTVLLCSICLRERHRDCKVVEDYEFRSFYGRKIREASSEIETEKHALLENTNSVAHALDTGITRLSNYRKELDEVINRLNSMKGEVDYHRHDIKMTSQAFSDIERSVSTSTELRQCKKLFASVDEEKGKFERRKEKVLLMPGRFRDEVTNSMKGLQKNVKSIRTVFSTELGTIQQKQLYGGSPIPKERSTQNSPYFNMNEKHMNRRPVMLEKHGRTSRRSVLDDGRFSQQSRSRLSVNLPKIQSKSPRNLPAMPHLPYRQPRNIPMAKFTSYRPPSRPVDIHWLFT